MISDKVYRQQSYQVESWALSPGNTVYHPSFRYQGPEYFHEVLISESGKAAREYIHLGLAIYLRVECSPRFQN